MCIYRSVPFKTTDGSLHSLEKIDFSTFLTISGKVQAFLKDANNSE
jgi:hypothetical protein